MTDRDAYWRDLPRPPQMVGTYIEWLEAMAQHYQILAAYHRDLAGEHRPSPLDRRDA